MLSQKAQEKQSKESKPGRFWGGLGKTTAEIIGKIVQEGIDLGVIGKDGEQARKLAEYVKATQSIGITDPLKLTNEQQLVKLYKAKGVDTVVGEKTINTVSN